MLTLVADIIFMVNLTLMVMIKSVAIYGQTIYGQKFNDKYVANLW